MFLRSQSWFDSYYTFWLKLSHFKKRARLRTINFNKSWTQILGMQKMYIALCLACDIIIQTFYTLYPLFIGWIIEKQNYPQFIYLMLAWLGIIILEYASVYCAALLEIQCINSVQYSAFQFFLTVDPIHHTMKASGKLFAKIERGARSYEDFLDIILFDILPVIIGIVTVVVTFLITDWHLGMVSLILLTLIAAINIVLNLFTSATFEQRLIDADDMVKMLSVESLTQVQLIRSSFATNEIAHEAHQRSKQMMYKEGTAWLAFAASLTISRLAYLASICILGSIIFSSIIQHRMSIVAGTTLLLTYINGTYEVIQIGRRLRKLIKAITRITDLYNFIRQFGKRTFPVLKGEVEKEVSLEGIKNRDIILEACDLHFDYNPKAKIFENHSLFLQVPRQQQSKLYGIIGPSGMGKTTLLSLLGGQLKPDSGIICLNGLSLYALDDSMRRILVAIQGQQASSLSGSLRHNLLLGLPEDKQVYTDEQIIAVLKEVGIWNVFSEKEGLASSIGEGGLTLSGGQRQRLNFAGLFLRAQYYKPLLILIDEPTSSLDEVSERAITHMITQLAENALTLVIAHRLKTLDDAVGILDFSLLEEEKYMHFYTREELEKKSIYYKRLLQGDITIDA